MNTQKIGEAVERALAYHDRIAIAEDVWAVEDEFADYLESVEKNLNNNEWIYFDKIYETMRKLRDGVSIFVNEAWDSIMYENRKGKLHLFENGHVGSKNDIDAQNTESLYSITLDWVDWEQSALAKEDGSKDYYKQSAFKVELEEHLYEVVLNDYLERWLDRIDDIVYLNKRLKGD